MPPKGWTKPRIAKPAPGSPEERTFLLTQLGFGDREKAIMLASALDAVTAGLSSPSVADRLRARLDGPRLPGRSTISKPDGPGHRA